MDDIKPGKNKGFTLIELMIVVAIIGILAAVAIPAYQDYTKRSYVAEGLSMASSLKASVAEYYASNGTWPVDNAAAGLSADISGNAVKSIVINSYVIRINFNDKVKDDSQLVLIASDQDGSIEWECRSTTGADEVIPDEYLPPRCR